MLSSAAPRRLSDIAFHGNPDSPYLRWFAQNLKRRMKRAGHTEVEPEANPGFVLNFINPDRPRPFRRNSQGTFVVGVVEVAEKPADLLPAAYPYLVKSLSNLLIYITPTEQGPETHFVTLEQGYYTAAAREGDALFEEVYKHIAPLASTRLVINNLFRKDLPESLWQGTEVTQAIYDAGQRLEAMNLLPAPFPITELLNERDMAHVKRLFGIGGLSYGNVSARHDADSFWMSARGVNKAQLRDVGRDILLIAGYEAEEDAIVVRVPPNVEPRGASVDAIEHWALYSEHPDIGAIIHIHAWIDGVASTTVNYPCGTYELAQEVADVVRAAPDPSRAIIGLKNHGLTITGRSLDDIFARIDGKILPQVPMT
ncbi:ribulose phosphate epimerase [Alkalilimnicola ehrlichii]|uniref:Ribulose phosphate epimerase n=2 Tax=Alkalilimnicola ehrlichii TaxID=351052 RepID=A0A3E0WLC4_9GAMM|nr:ribulose phosphate epimerase [Alkalilimnicola ehrlichii]RFA33608.1 ribulose phosphate epimerase [Alkalilimnicola ehrlichii]